MSPGALAGVILASVVIVLLLVLIAMYWRRRTATGQQINFGLSDPGFENQTYRYDTATDQVTDTRGHLNLRTMSESSS